MVQPELNIEWKPLSALRPRADNPRTHSRKQIQQIAQSIRIFGFTNPVLVGDDLEIIAGHGRVMAARSLGMAEAPTLKLSGLTAEQRRAYVIADNKLALNAGWDPGILAIEFQGLLDLGFDVSLTGFSPAEIDLTFDLARNTDVATPEGTDAIPEPPNTAVTRPGDIWSLGRHRLLCGDARSRESVQRLMEGRHADLIFTDPPYNVEIDGNVCGLGSVRHREFAMAAGEMTSAQFTAFLTDALGAAASFCRDGAIAYVCMDWRHMRELLAAGSSVFSELKNLCGWNKTNGGMGTFYRSKHELVFVFKVGTGAHVNNFGLGETGRPRANVWDYAGVSSMTARRAEELAMNPTVKPVALVADAIRDCSPRGGIVLDTFGGSGSTLIASEITGRLARLIEFDPAYCDTIVARWEGFMGRAATLAATNQTFETVAVERGAPLAIQQRDPGLSRQGRAMSRRRARAG